LSTRDTINPYLTATGLVASRLRWDLDYRSWISRFRLKRLRGSQKGEKAVIVCNGPSLLGTDWSLLDGLFTFGLNKINLLFDDHAFRPDCIVAVNPLVLEQNAKFYRVTDILLFLDCKAVSAGIGLRDNLCYLHSASICKFARDVSVSVFQGGTVTYVAMQLAFHMGFDEVALIGCDHSYAVDGPPNAEADREGPDRDHFHPAYFPGGSRWHLPDLAQSEAYYSLARTRYREAGRRLVNATDGGYLELLPRQSLQEFVSPGDGRGDV
jgi:hypothetical protein